MTPSTPSYPFKLGEIEDPLSMYLQDLYTVGINLAGLPAMSIPAGLYEEKLPYGLQLIGPQLGDRDVFNFAHQFEKAFEAQTSPLVDKEVN